MKIFNCILILLIVYNAQAQNASKELTSAEITELINDFKKDERGPYQAIRWFCTDGSIILPKERCPQPGGIQHALPKDVVSNLAKKQSIYLGQILAGTDFDTFWDAANGNSRIKQYILEQYLQSIDDGWIMRKGRFYRGAVQAEDEADWGYRFLIWLVSSNENIISNYFLVRQACRSLPHNASDRLWERIRAVSKTLSDSLETFINIRVKLHGQPDSTDILKVQKYRTLNKSRIKESLLVHFDQLEKDLIQAYKPLDTTQLRSFEKQLSSVNAIKSELGSLITLLEQERIRDKNSLQRVIQLMWKIRQHLPATDKPAARLAMLDLSIALETMLFQNIGNWPAETVSKLLEKAGDLVLAITACGFLESWEYEKIKPFLNHNADSKKLSLDALRLRNEYLKRSVDWGSSMVRSAYQDVLDSYAAFEPLVHSFIDDRIRVSVLLSLGNIAGKFRNFYAEQTGIKNNVLNIPSENQIIGLNSGFALGEINVLETVHDDYDFDPAKIYVMAHPPADLKPVSGILSVSEGNLVSHVQLLARNLGIPNAVITSASYKELSAYNGKTVFYAVSPSGAVIIKTKPDMTEAEKNLFKKNTIREEKFLVPVDKIDTGITETVNLRDLRADKSGIIAGPKAANLGELKHLFPENVVEGFAIPFGSYRRHLQQQMPGRSETYWQYLNRIFQTASQIQKSKSEKDAEEFILAELAILREAIKKINLLESFQADIKKVFISLFGKSIGQVAVFLRSDTNMEDLKHFTGAGLNLTVFNVKDEYAIWQGIRDVWASPFSERSYRWRQRLLLNPENIYPSILVIPSVNNDKSGVMITTGIYSGNHEDITVAFNRGSGGAVEGQMAESYTIDKKGNAFLLSPAREIKYTILAESGGVKKVYTSFQNAILIENNLKELLEFSILAKNKMKGKTGFDTSVPLDIELGFKDNKIWLFQVRPFVESKRAKSTIYLNQMDPDIDMKRTINLDRGY